MNGRAWLDINKKKRQKEILVLLDWENIKLSLDLPRPEGFSLVSGFDRLMKKLGEIGKVELIYLFAPPGISDHFLEIFYHQGINIVSCPKITPKGKGPKRDTTDETMIRLGKELIDRVPTLTHLCICSGDKDFCGLARYAIRRGLKIIITAASKASLAPELIDLASKDPKTKGKRVIWFIPQKKTE